MKNNPKWLIIGFALAALLLCVSALLFLFRSQLTLAKNNRAAIGTAVYAISPPPQATPLRCNSSGKIDNALVECFYTTDLLHDQIEAYYTQVLAEQGWNYVGSDTVPDTPNDLRSAIYCKGKYAAALYYSPRGYDYSYTFSMSWGLHHCK
jgi:hypothetical protein